MDEYVLNEYVVADCERDKKSHWDVIYEPLDRYAVYSTLNGYICLVGADRKEIRFSHGTTYLLVGSDDVLRGIYDSQSRRIMLSWKELPGEHYLCVSYILENREIHKIDWLREGF